MTYVLFHSRFQLSSPQRFPMAAILEKKKARGGRWEERKGGGGGRGLAFSLSSSHRPPFALFFSFSPILSPSHIMAVQFLQLEKQSTVNDKWRTFFIVLYASLMTPCDGITQVSAVV